MGPGPQATPGEAPASNSDLGQTINERPPRNIGENNPYQWPDRLSTFHIIKT